MMKNQTLEVTNKLLKQCSKNIKEYTATIQARSIKTSRSNDDLKGKKIVKNLSSE